MGGTPDWGPAGGCEILDDMEVIGGYRLVRRIGSGGMGTVWEAHDADGRPVALKVLHPHISRDPSARARLAREVDLLHRVRGKGVARVLDAEVDGEEAFIVTELVVGPTLEEDVAAHGPFSTAELAGLAHGLADALSAIHRVGVVHRDLKPGNVMLSAAGPVVIDFGIAQVADDPRLTQPGMVTGTPGYLDPEVVDGAAPSPAGDWWAWAAVLVFAATGRKPFGTGPSVSVLKRMSTGAVDVEGLEDLVGTALWAALQPDHRQRLDANAVLAVLDGRWSASDLDEALAALALVPPHRTSTAVLPVSGATAALPAGGATAALPVGGATAALPAGGTTRVLAPAPAAMPPSYPATRVTVRDAEGPPAGPSGSPSGPWSPEPWGEREGQPPPAWIVPAPARPGVVAAVGWFAVAAAGTWPGIALLLVATLMLLSGTVGHASRFLRAQRMKRGLRRGDTARAVAATPWHLLRAALTAAFLLVLAGGTSWIALQVSDFLLTPAVLGAWAPIRESLLLWAAAVLFVLVGWFGPGAAVQREGARSIMAVVLPYSAMRAVLAGLCALFGVGFVIAVLTGTLPDPTWQPLGGPG